MQFVVKGENWKVEQVTKDCQKKYKKRENIFADVDNQEAVDESGKPPRSGQTKRIPSVVLSGEDFTYNLKGLSNNTYYNVVIRLV